MRGKLFAGCCVVLFFFFNHVQAQDAWRIADSGDPSPAVSHGPIPTDPVELEKAARNGDAHAQYRLAMRYFQGAGVPMDINSAMRWMRSAADAGIPSAAYQLGVLYRDGQYIARDARLSETWFRIAASSGHSGAARAIGALQDAQASGEFTSVRANAFRGDPKAQYELALWYQRGKEPVGADPVEAVKWFQQAAEQDNAEAAYELGLAYLDGNGATRNLKMAKQWLERAAGQGLLRARVTLRDIARDENGNGIDALANLKNSATQPFFQAATSGDANAQYEFALMLFKGDPVPRDARQALYWMRRAAEQDNVNAQMYLGEAYTRGTDVDGDLSEAAAWYSRAARLGNAEAQFRLGDLYRLGWGVKQSPQAARHWYTEAARQGHAKAREKLVETAVSQR